MPLHLATLFGFTVIWLAMQGLKQALVTVTPTVQFVVEPFQGAEVNLPDLLLNVFMLHGVGIRWTDAFNFPSWSVSLEFWTYFVFALICIVAVRKNRITATCAGASACALLWFLSDSTQVAAAAESFYVKRDFVRIALSFGLGVVAAYLRGRVSDRIKGVEAFQFVTSLASVGLIAFVGLYPSLIFWAPLVFSMWVFALSFDSGSGTEMLRSPCLRWLGERSYAIYMVHALVLLPFAALANRLLEGWHLSLAVVYVVVVVLAASWAYRFIEQPWRVRFNSYESR